jgi:hypothetical protein
MREIDRLFNIIETISIKTGNIHLLYESWLFNNEKRLFEKEWSRMIIALLSLFINATNMTFSDSAIFRNYLKNIG